MLEGIYEYTIQIYFISTNIFDIFNIIIKILLKILIIYYSFLIYKNFIWYLKPGLYLKEYNKLYKTTKLFKLSTVIILYTTSIIFPIYYNWITKMNTLNLDITQITYIVTYIENLINFIEIGVCLYFFVLVIVTFKKHINNFYIKTRYFILYLIFILLFYTVNINFMKYSLISLLYSESNYYISTLKKNLPTRFL